MAFHELLSSKKTTIYSKYHAKLTQSRINRFFQRILRVSEKVAVITVQYFELKFPINKEFLSTGYSKVPNSITNPLT